MQEAAVTRAVTDIIQHLAVHVPGSHHLVDALISEPIPLLDHATQTITGVWLVGSVALVHYGMHAQSPAKAVR